MNPYTNRLMIGNPENFFDRKSEIKRVFSRIGASRPQSISVVGDRRIGKSSLLYHICNEHIRGKHLENPEKLVFAYFDFQERKSMNVEEFFRIITEKITKNLNKSVNPVQDFSYDSFLKLIKTIEENDINLILIFDEFDVVTTNKNFSSEFMNGKKYAIVGPSGSGKTTLINLISKFYNISNGNIKIDGNDLNDFNIKELRRNIGIVQQEVFIFPGTLKENISYGKQSASDEQIVEAAKKANLHDEIMKFDDGYDTYIGENGVKLSGGQRQRVSIARMFLKDPQLLILDEATSALDTITEQKIQDAFEKLMQNRTSITIAHRLTTITNSDKILVIEDGNLVMDGSHNELIQENGLYKDLYNAMMKETK